MDGYVTIGAKLNLKQLEKDLKVTEKELQQLENERLKMSNDLEKKLARKKALGQEIETSRGDIRKAKKEYSEITKEINFINEALKQNEGEIESSKNNISLIKGNIVEAKKEIEKDNVISSISQSVNAINKSLKNTITSVVKWGLALIGVRGVFSFISSSMHIIAQYDKQLGADIQYIKYAIAMTLKPVIEYIVNLVYKLLQYLGYIIQKWTGYNIFKYSSKGVYNTIKGVKELKKQLAGFDEMNVLSDTSGGSGGGTPSIDLSKLKGDVPEWVDWIATHGDLVIQIIEGIGVALAGLKLADLFTKLGLIEGQAKALMGLGIGLALYGIIETIKNIMVYIKDPTWENFTPIMESLGIAITGVGIALVAMNMANPIGWIVALTGVVMALTPTLNDWFDEIVYGTKSTRSLKKAQDELNEAIKESTRASNELARAYDNAEEEEKKLNELEKKHKLSGAQLYREVQNGTLTYAQMTKAQKDVYKQYLNTLTAMEQLEKASTDNVNAQQNEINKRLESQLSLSKTTEDYNKFGNAVVEAWNKGKISTDEAQKLIAKAMGEMDKDVANTFSKTLPENLKKGLDAKLFKNDINKFKNDIVKALIITNPLTYTIKYSVDVVKKITGHKKGAIAYFKKGGIVDVPKLASGGIVNQPGRGVPLTSAIAGEHGAEGVIPLTDSQQMRLLGEAIGKYITINATITNTMNGRVISKEIQRINNDNQFIYNG